MKQLVTIIFISLLSISSFADTVYVYNKLVIPDSLIIASKNIGDKENVLEKNFNSLLLAFVTICVSLLTYIGTKSNVEKQLKVQQRTTIHKEWINNIQTHLSEFLYQITEIHIFFNAYHKETDKNKMVIELNDILKTKEQMGKSYSALKLVLNPNSRLESGLLDKIDEILNLLEDFKPDATQKEKNLLLTNQINSIVLAYHKLLESFK